MTRSTIAVVVVLAACSHGASKPPGEQQDAPLASDAVPPRDAPADAQSARFLCSVAPPANAPEPTPPPMYASCPTLVAGTNTITSSGTQRQFELVLPTTPQADEQYPVLFMWYWLGGSAG